MARTDDILTLDDDLDGPESKQEDSNRRPGARRTLELYLEHRALRRQLEDTFCEDSYGVAELDM